MKKTLKKALPLLLLIASFAIALPFLTSCSGSIDGVNASEVVNLVFPQPIIFAAQFIATIILFIAVSKFVWKPYNEMLAKRKEYVMKGVNEVEAKKQEIFAQEEQLKLDVADAQMKSTELLQNAKVQSETIISESQVEAKNNYESTVKEAQEEIARMKLRMQKDLQHENIDLVLSATEQLTMKNIDSADNRKFIEDFLNQIDKEL